MEKVRTYDLSRTAFCFFVFLVGISTFLWISFADLGVVRPAVFNKYFWAERDVDKDDGGFTDTISNNAGKTVGNHNVEKSLMSIEDDSNFGQHTVALHYEKHGLSLRQKLRLANLFGPDADYHIFITSLQHLVNITIQRLSARITQRLARAGKHLVRANETDSLFNETLYLTPLMYQGGLGNFMFITASSWGLAQTNQRTISFFEKYWAEPYFFNLGIRHVNMSVWRSSGNENLTSVEDDIHTNFTLYEQHPLTFKPEMTEINDLSGNSHVALGGYLQSWKYFDQYRDDIRSLFTFNRSIYVQAYQQLRIRLTEHYNGSSTNSSGSYGDSKFHLPTLVGIHVRRGDINDPDQQKHGHRAASEEYLLRAPLRLQAQHRNVLFLVFSNDMEYCQKLYSGLDNYIFMTSESSKHVQAAVDMAVLSLMDHLILTVGSFGWWAAYLSDAKDVYYFKDWPRECSTMKNGSKAEDYFLPQWKPFI